MGGIGRRLYETNMGPLTLASDEVVRELIGQAAAEIEDHKFSPHFLWTEWSRVVDAWQLETWDAYRDVMRLGRKTRLAEAQRAVLWSIFSKVHDGLAERERLTEASMFQRLEHHFETATHPPFEYYVIDEAQDIGVAAAHVTEAFPMWSFLKRVPARPMTRCSPATALIPAFARGRYLAASVSGAGSHGSPTLRSDIVLVRPSDGMDTALHSGLSRRRYGGLPSRHQRGGHLPPLVRSWLSCQRCVGMVRPPRRAGSAVVILGSPKTEGHSPKARLVAMTIEVRS